MEQPATRRHPGPTVYLMGFSCLPGDREYSEAQRATGSETPYWFKERRVYGEFRAKPHTVTTTVMEPKRNMTDVRVHEEKDRIAKEKDKTVKEENGVGMETAQEKLESVDGKEKGNSVIQETTDKNEKKAHSPRHNKSPSAKPKTVPLPGKRVRFAWSIAMTTKRQVPYAPHHRHLHKRSLGKGMMHKRKKRNSSDISTVNATEAEDKEDLYLLDRFPSPPRSHQRTPSLSDILPRQLNRQSQEREQDEEESQEASSELRPQSPTPATTQLEHTTDIYNSSDDTLERDEPGMHREQGGRKDSFWTVCLRFCLGKRK